MIREFNEQWEKETVETLEAQDVRRKSVTEKNAHRDDIDEAMREHGWTSQVS